MKKRPSKVPFIRYKEELLGPQYIRTSTQKAQEILDISHKKEDHQSLQEETDKILSIVLPKKKKKEQEETLDLMTLIKTEQKKLRAKEAINVGETRDRAIRFGFIGVGQGGSRIAESFNGLGYPTIVMNTSTQDLDGLHILDKYKIAIGEDGAGKDMDIGARAIKSNRDKILSTLATTFEEKVDHIMVTVGGGGGTGSGGILDLIEVLEYGEYKDIGVIFTLPLKGEDTRSKTNTINTLKRLVALNNDGRFSPFIIVDNAKVMEKHPGISTTEFWAKANTEITQLFHLFNMLTFKKTSYTTLDPADYRNIIKTGGFTIFGRTPITDFEEDSLQEAIDIQISQSDGLLADGFNVISAQTVGGIIVGKPEVLQNFPREKEEYIFNTLRKRIRAGTVYRGVYAMDKLPDNRIELLTIWSGLDTPATRIKELFEESKREGKIVDKKVEATSIEDILAGLEGDE